MNNILSLVNLRMAKSLYHNKEVVKITEYSKIKCGSVFAICRDNSSVSTSFAVGEVLAKDKDKITFKLQDESRTVEVRYWGYMWFQLKDK